MSISLHNYLLFNFTFWIGKAFVSFKTETTWKVNFPKPRAPSPSSELTSFISFLCIFPAFSYANKSKCKYTLLFPHFLTQKGSCCFPCSAPCILKTWALFCSFCTASVVGASLFSPRTRKQTAVCVSGPSFLIQPVSPQGFSNLLLLQTKGQRMNLWTYYMAFPPMQVHC